MANFSGQLADKPKYSDLADEALVALLECDDERAFTELYNRYWKSLFTMASYRLENVEEAEEVVQEIFTSLWIRRRTLKITAGLARYLAVSVKYRVIKVLDKRYSKQRYLSSLIIRDQTNSTEEQLSFDELNEELSKFVGQLPERCQLVFRMSREEGLSQKQIAATLKISEKTVESHLRKAFQTLRLKLADFMTLLL